MNERAHLRREHRRPQGDHQGDFEDVRGLQPLRSHTQRHALRTVDTGVRGPNAW